MAKWWFVAVLTALVVTPSVVLGACPNKCSGHGRCGLNDVCDCMQNWVGGDCSGRQCPFTRAWQDTAQRKDDAHYSAECGNRGTCDRTIGECSCDAGFVGSGCRRMQCPNDCSGHGTCEFIEELAGNAYNKRIQGTTGITYESWDQEKIMGCVCDGDDPLTPNQKDMVQAIVINQAGGSGYLTYHDPYGNIYTTEKITFDTFANNDKTCDNIEVALRRLPNNVLNEVDVSIASTFYAFTRTDRTDPTGSGKLTPKYYNNGLLDNNAAQRAICEVIFKSEPGTTGYQHLLECNPAPHADPGHHPISAGSVGATCDVYEVYAELSIADTSSPVDHTYDNVKAAGTLAYRILTELTECSGRGTCDYSTGTCACFAGHMGLACQKQEALV